MLTSSSAEAISTLHSFLEPDQKHGEGFNLVLMDHDPQQYLQDLLAVEREELLCSSGCSVLLINRRRGAEDLREVLDHVRVRADCWRVKTELQNMVEIFYQKETGNDECDSKI